MIRRIVLIAGALLCAGSALAAIDVTLESANSDATSIANCTVDKPANTAEGNFLFAVVHVENDVSVTEPSGWSLITNFDHPDIAQDTLVYYKRAGASEPTTYTWTHSSTWRACFIKRFTGVVASGDPQDATLTTNSSNTGTTATMTGLTTATDGAALVGIIDTWNGGTDFSAWSSPLTEYYDGSYLGIAAGVQTTAGASGNKTATVSASQAWAAILIALKPESGSIDQEGFSFGDDNGSESAHTLGTQDSNYTGALGVKTLRVLANVTGTGPTMTPVLRYQKNGSGGYVAVSTSSITEYTAGAVEAGDLTKSGNNTASTSWAVSVPAASAGDLIIINMNWDDSTTTTDVAMGNGRNGETASVIIGPVASHSTSTRSKAWYFITTGAWASGTVISTPTASEQWTATVIKVPAGEFDSSTPIGVSASSVSLSATYPVCPAITVGSTDGGGRLICYLATDVDDPDGTSPKWTSLASVDRGAIGDEVEVTTTPVTNSQAFGITSGWTLPTAAAWTSLSYVIRAPAATANQVYISTSANVAAGGESTTARLSAPSGKTTTDFDAGRRWDDENGSDTVTVTDDDYTEVEWVITTQSPATTSDYFDFRVYNGGTAFGTYTVTPRWTIGSSGGGTAGFTRRRIIY